MKRGRALFRACGPLLAVGAMLVVQPDARAAHSAESLPWLHVERGLLVDEVGHPIRLVGQGISPIASERTLAYGNVARAVSAYRHMGCNAMRVAIYRNHDYDQSRDRLSELGPERFVAKEVDPLVQIVLAQGMYVVLDWHQFPSSLQGLSDTERIRYWQHQVVQLWKHLARRYASEPGVAIYELWNEPNWPGHRLGDPKQIPLLRRWYQACIEAIRAEDRRHVLMVSDHNAGWGRAIEEMWLGPDGHLLDVDRLDPPQIVYSHHAAAISELRGENLWAESFSRRHAVPVAYGEVELQPGVDESNRMLGPLQPGLLQKLIRRQLGNGLHQVWLGWRTGIDTWLDIWRPLCPGSSKSDPRDKIPDGR